MLSRQVECPFCRKKRRLFDLLGNNNKANIEIKCKQCGSKLRISINGDDIKIQGVETA